MGLSFRKCHFFFFLIIIDLNIFFFAFWQVGAASKKVLVQCPGALNSLRESEDKINELKVTAFEHATARGMTQRRAKAAVCNIDANCTRIGEAVATAMETMTAVDNDYKKIKAAMLW